MEASLLNKKEEVTPPKIQLQETISQPEMILREYQENHKCAIRMSKIFALISCTFEVAFPFLVGWYVNEIKDRKEDFPEK